MNEPWVLLVVVYFFYVYNCCIILRISILSQHNSEFKYSYSIPIV